MNFVSYSFVIFLLSIWAAFLIMPSRFRIPFLTVASYVFYGTWSIPFIAVILVTTTVDYLASHIIYKSTDPLKRKQAVTFAIVMNLIVLGFFKYFNFFLGSCTTIFTLFGMHSPMPKALNIILPLGISYYTFEAISYVVDVYRGGKPAPSWWQYNFYIMYFPHLISGPVIRFNELWSQYSKPLMRPSMDRIARGLELILLGYVFKVMIADAAATVADPVFGHASAATPLSAYIGTLAFTTQVYFDFMGYTHIARGASLLFNIELPLNFNHAFCATNIANFWERWQISLSRWIRDYLFIPLGGSRLGTARTIFNLFFVMAIAGAWHGAGWNYLIWGCFHGLLLVIYHSYRLLRPRLLGVLDATVTNNIFYRVCSIILTFHCVAAACVIFRSPDVSSMTQMFAHVFKMNAVATELVHSVTAGDFTSGALLIGFLLCCFSGPLLVRLYEQAFVPMPVWAKAYAGTSLVVLCWIMCGSGLQPFIYFQF